MSWFLALASVAAICADFDGDLKIAGVDPVKAENIRLVAGIEGQAVHVPTNGVLEYALTEGTLNPDEGTFICWFKLDWTPWGGLLYRDDAKLEDGTWPDSLWRAYYKRNLFTCGPSYITGGILQSAALVGMGESASWVGQIFAGEWHQLAVVWESGVRLAAYFDGQQLQEEYPSKKEASVFGTTFQLGCGGNLPGLGGAIDGVRIYTRALTDEEIAASYAEHMAERIEILDAVVHVGEEERVRFRARNLRTGELREYTRAVRAERPGAFTLDEGGRTFELYALERPTNVYPQVLGGQIDPFDVSKDQATLVAQFDCAREADPSYFNTCGDHVVTNGALSYRELDLIAADSGFVYRFHTDSPDVPHLLEFDYPDDLQRTFPVCIYRYKYGRIYTGTLDCCGIMTGIDNPLTGQVKTKRQIFWPHAEDILVAILGYKANKGEHPPAATAIRVYRLDKFDEKVRALGNPPAGQEQTRTACVWDEDPTMDADLAFNQAFCYRDNDLNFWYDKWAHTISYMKAMGLDSWDIKVVSYFGDVTGMKATLEHQSWLMSANGRRIGWDTLGARMLEDAGLDFWVRLNNVTPPSGWFQKFAGLDSPDDLWVEDLNGKKSEYYCAVPYRFYHPKVKAALRRFVAAYRDRYTGRKNFRGITLCEQAPLFFTSLDWGYDKYTTDLFAAETGVAVPGETAHARYEYLTGDSTRKAKWIEWRCAKNQEILSELAHEIRAGANKTLELRFWIEANWFSDHPERWPDPTWSWNEDLRAAGVDMKAVNAIPGVRFLPVVRPYRCRNSGVTAVNEPYLERSPEEAELIRDAGVTDMMICNYGVLEIVNRLMLKENRWKRAFWWTIGNNVPNVPNFYSYSIPHPSGALATELPAHLIAEYDLQDLMHGYWGIPESGEPDAFRTFYLSYRSIPRGRFDLLEGYSNDPVAIRVSQEGKGWYAVNRLPYHVRLSFADGKLNWKVTLKPCEIRYFRPDCGLGVPKAVGLTTEIEKKAKAYFNEVSQKLSAVAKASPGQAELAHVIGEMEKAAAEGRWGRVRALHLTRAARAARLANPISVSPKLVRETREIELILGNFDAKRLDGTAQIVETPAGWAAKGGPVLFSTEPGGETRVRLPLVSTNEVLAVYETFRIRILSNGVEDELCYSFPPLESADWVAPDQTPAMSGWLSSVAWMMPGGAEEAKRVMDRVHENPLLKDLGSIDAGFSFSLAPDGSGIRFRADVVDPEYIPPETEGAMYEKDCIQLYFDQRNNALVGPSDGYDEDDVVFQLGTLNGKPTLYMEEPQRKPVDSNLTVVHENGHTVYDVFIPKSLLPYARLSPGEVIGCDILVNQRMRDQKGEYSFGMSFGSPYRHPAQWRDLYLR